jgi:protein-S-isoprenylcysteine O-methyltransferase Ste14
MPEARWICVFLLIAIVVPLRFHSMFRKRNLVRGERRHRWTSVSMFLAIAGIYTGTIISLIFGISFLDWTWLIIGGIIYMIGICLRRLAIRTLGKYFSPYIEIRDSQPLIKSGPFRYMRHPNYAGLILEAIGLPLAFQTPLILLFVAIVYIPLIMLRIQLEESELIKSIGETYIDYQRVVYAILPIRR